MNRRRFLFTATSLLATGVLAKPVETASVRSPAVSITLITSPERFVAGRQATASAFASGLMPQNATVRLRGWWDPRTYLDPPKIIRFTDDLDCAETLARGHVVTLDSDSLTEVGAVEAMPSRPRSITRILGDCLEGAIWPAVSDIVSEPENGAAVIRVPAYWYQQYYHQIRGAQQGAPRGKLTHEAVAERGHSLAHILEREEGNLSHITAIALLRTARGAVHQAAFDEAVLIARMHCITDHRGLRETRIEVM